MTTALPLMKNVLAPLAKSILPPLGLPAAASAADEAIQKKIYDSGTTLEWYYENSQVPQGAGCW